MQTKILQRTALIMAITGALVITGCGSKEEGADNGTNAPLSVIESQNSAVREHIKTWLANFDANLEAGETAYGTKGWYLPGETLDTSSFEMQMLSAISCPLLSKASAAPVQATNAGGMLAQTRALWLYTASGCGGNDINTQTQTLGVLESSRRRLAKQWDLELAAVPGSVRIEAKSGERAAKVNLATTMLVASEQIACMSQLLAVARKESEEVNMGRAMSRCDEQTRRITRYDACPMDWSVVSGHNMADKAGLPRDDQAWMGDATARFRMAWRACSPDSMGLWKAYLPQVPQHLRQGRLLRISSTNDPIMDCQFRLFRKIADKGPEQEGSRTDDKVIRWCELQLGTQYISHEMVPPNIFTLKELNDSGIRTAWLYDPAKKSLRTEEWKITECMTNVAIRLKQQGYNVPAPKSLDMFCGANNRKAALDYLSGQSLVDGAKQLKGEYEPQ